MKKIPVFLFLFISVLYSCIAQDKHLVDSLQKEIKKFDAHKKDLGTNATPLMDSIKANFLYTITKQYWTTVFDTASIYANECLTVSEASGYKKGMGNAYNALGVINTFSNKPELALEFHTKALKVRNEIGDKKGVGGSYRNIGLIYQNEANYSEALKNYLKAVEIYEQAGYKKGTADAYTDVGVIYENTADYTNALLYHSKAQKIYTELGDKSGSAIAYNNLGLEYDNLGNYAKALECYREALQLFDEMGDKKASASSAYSNIAVIYYKEGNYPEALNYNLKALKIREELNDKLGLEKSYTNIGIVYNYMGNYTLSLENYSKGLQLSKEIDDKPGIASAYNNIGLLYYNQGRYQEALQSDTNALIIRTEIGDKKGMADAYTNIGSVYASKKNYAMALSNALHALKLYDEIGLKDGIALAEIEAGEADEKLNQMQEAYKYVSDGLKIAGEIGSKEEIKDAYGELAKIDAGLNNFKSAYDNEVQFKKEYDSIYNKENEKKLTGLQMQYDFDKKQDSIKAEQVQKDAVHNKELEDQKRIRNYTLGGLAIVLFFLVFVFIQRNKIAREKKRSDELLLNILPSEVAEELKEKGRADAKLFDDVTVIFTDFKGFTSIAEKLTAKELVDEIDYCFKGFDNIIHKYGIEKIKTIGDSYMAAGGLPVANKTHASDVVSAALEIVAFMEAHKQQRLKDGRPVFEIRIGLNTGPVVAGIVGVKKFAYDIWGDTVNLASRMESSGEPGRVNISGNTYELVKNSFTCTYRGKVQAKNKGEVDMYFVS